MHAFYAILANVVLVVHVAIVWFVIFGLLLTILGGVLQWSWVRNFWFRATHLAMIGFVVVQAWCGEICPLTLWEQDLRRAAGQDSYEGSFVAYWLGKLIWFPWTPRTFTIVYTVFGLAVAGALILVPPRWSRRKSLS